MFRAAFEKKFGEDLVPNAPTTPGVYRYLDEGGAVLYVGKAKNLRRRLANYRDANRKRAHRKMRTLVREAHSLSYETCESEQHALLREGDLIRRLRPAFNVAGAFTFLYPSLGFAKQGRHTLLCFTTQPERYTELELEWYGCFRSRPRVKLAFEALIELLSLLAHREKVSRLPSHPKFKGSRLVGFRQMPTPLVNALPRFFAGDSPTLPAELATRLLNKPRALRDASDIEAQLKLLRHFHEADAVRLRATLTALGREGSHVSQDERDELFIRSAFQESSAGG